MITTEIPIDWRKHACSCNIWLESDWMGIESLKRILIASINRKNEESGISRRRGRCAWMKGVIEYFRLGVFLAYLLIRRISYIEQE